MLFYSIDQPYIQYTVKYMIKKKKINNSLKDVIVLYKLFSLSTIKLSYCYLLLLIAISNFKTI